MLKLIPYTAVLHTLTASTVPYNLFWSYFFLLFEIMKNTELEYQSRRANVIVSYRVLLDEWFFLKYATSYTRKTTELFIYV